MMLTELQPYDLSFCLCRVSIEGALRSARVEQCLRTSNKSITLEAEPKTKRSTHLSRQHLVSEVSARRCRELKRRLTATLGLS